MKFITAFFRLVRWPNLLIIALTQWLVWQFVIVPVHSWGTVPLFLTGFHFSLLCLSTVCIAGAGYIINDYFDVRIDVINKPGKVIIERIISRRGAIALHSILNAAGLLMALYLAWKLGNPWLLLIQLGCTVLLWFYSTRFKREFITGNLTVAFLVAFTVLILAVFEPALYPYFRFDLFLNPQGRKIINPLGVIIVYAFFAFILTWMREIVKDMEDFKGDVEEGCITMPIKIGLRQSVCFVLLLGLLGILPLLIAAIKLIRNNYWYILGLYIFIALIVPIIYFLRSLPQKATQEHYKNQSLQLKIIMVAGILSLLVYWWLQY